MTERDRVNVQPLPVRDPDVTDPSTRSGSWLTVSEAATRTGLHIDRLRSMVRRGKLEKRRGNRGEWLVLVPAEMMTGSDQVGGSA